MAHRRRMNTVSLPSTNGKYTRKAWFIPAEGIPAKIAVFLDAEYYLDHMDTPAVIAGLTERGAIPPLACLFISSGDAEARHHDFTCSDPFSDYIANDALPWAVRKAGLHTRSGHLIAGLSLSGLQAAYMTLGYPGTFSHALSQSGSFWWEDEWLAKHLREFIPSEGKFWLSVGSDEKGAGMVHPPTELCQNTDQDVAVANMATGLKSYGHTVRHHVFDGGHNTRCWKDDLPQALEWLLSKTR
ncbi:alpha/beta hydrolase-fold protein [Luteolibacter sp. SL250]|uniref:alpha/beta hydrolase n=1 Tax=Luteolibacter sp. SL250 TaxID=2995170 RepID=UPI00226EEE1A|nr:alpha/beta hydrolase-fold protein [Luteolibacter sp. SL250]WAC18419.1 alpha/beta hydrolase-fold protein [Luteolibacter sp. SL250]